MTKSVASASENAMTGATTAMDWVVVFAVLAIATATGLAMDSRSELTGHAMVYVLAVVIASYTTRWIPAVTCAVLAAGSLNFFFVAPRLTLRAESPENLLGLAVMLCVALTISHLGTGLRREAELARLNERRAKQLQELATTLANVATPESVQSVVLGALDTVFPGRCAVAIVSSTGALEGVDNVPPSIRDGLRACIREKAAIGPGTARWPDLEDWYLPLGTEGQVTGAARVARASESEEAAREHAQAVCSIAGQALRRLQLSKDMRSAEEQSQWHRAQNAFLAAISHDFRTPLASILGASSTLRLQKDRLSGLEQDGLLQVLESETRHLVALTDNTLQLARLGCAGELELSWESIEEIVGSVLVRMRQRDVGSRLRARVPPNLPLITADPVLLSQLLENLLDNALKYSAGAVDVEVQLNGQCLEVLVKDRGKGVSPDDESRIFEAFERGENTDQRGAGLGLAVCRAIAHAHGGELVMRSRDGGGSSFVLTLPVDTGQPMSAPK